MKKSLKFSAICLAAFAAISCSSLEINDVQSVYSYEDFTFSAQYKPDVAKTHLGTVTETNAEVLWDNTDNLTVFSKTVDSPSNRKFEISNIQGTSASFSGSVEETTASFVAIYPYTAGATYSNGVISGCSIPTTQSATAGSFANGSALAIANATRTPGQTDCGSISFANLCSVISFVLPSDITFAKSITVTAKSDVKMAGTVSIDAENESILSASAGSVTLNGTFAGGNTYYVVVAPGSYSGFSFNIATTAGNSYSRETTKSFTAVAGEIYPLGTLSLALGQDAFTTSISITHNVASGILNGSTAKFSLSFDKSEFAGLVKNVSTTVTLKDGNSTVCRSKTVSGTSVSDVELDMQNGFHYLPKGEYSYSAEITYTVNNGTKDVQRTLVCSGSVASPQPAGFSVGATLSGYTSYSKYKGTDGRAASVSDANNCDNATIYAVGATYASGLSADVYSQCSSLLAVNSTLDGSVASGNVGSQSWSAHTIGASWSFDGAGGTCDGTKTVYVTGLPYNPSNSSVIDFKSDWSFSGGASGWEDKKNRYKLRDDAVATFKGFYIPANINGTVNYRIEAYVASRFNDLTTKFTVGATSVLNEKISGTAKTVEYKNSKDVAFSTSAKTMSCQSKGSSSSWATSQVWVYYISVIYR